MQNAVLSDNIDNYIAKYIGSDNCLDVYAWIEKNTIQLRAWALFKITGLNTLNPYNTASIANNAMNQAEINIRNAYLFVDEMYPLPTTPSQKENVRLRIYDELGEYDIYDIAADLSKRICMLERLVVRLVDAMMKNQSCPNDIVLMYGPLITRYMSALDVGAIRDRTDLEDNAAVFNKLQNRTAKIADIVKEEMFNVT